jgi:tetratricopeptide (TPR) repeat protein
MTAIVNDPAAAEAFLARGQFTDAANVAATCLFEDPRNPRLLCIMALAERGMGRPVDAMRNVTDALRIDPRYAWAYSIRALLYLEANCLIESERDASRAAQLDPHWAEPRLLRARALSRMRRYGEAKMSVHQALAIDPAIAGARELLQVIGAVEEQDSADYQEYVARSDEVTARVAGVGHRSFLRKHTTAVVTAAVLLFALAAQAMMVVRLGVKPIPSATLWLAVAVVVLYVRRRPS